MEVPESFKCPITKELMKDPVLCKDGNSWERKAITEWLQEHHQSPLTRNPMEVSDLIPNRALKELIENFLEGRGLNVVTHTEEVLVLDPTIKDEFELTVGVHNNQAKISIIPSESNQKSSVNLVCVVDVSGSMSTPAQVPGMKENTGLSILDIVKHAVKTIIKSLDSNDSLAIVSFTDYSEVVLELTKMDPPGQALAIAALNQLQPLGSTNLWAGLETGLEVLKKKGNTGKLSACFILTDGESNCDPPRGIIPTFKSYVDKNGLPGLVNTFGFGYSLDSQLLNEIANIGRGSYSFIPGSYKPILIG
jgi:Mg-chelatase subunit ChlD